MYGWHPFHLGRVCKLCEIYTNDIRQCFAPAPAPDDATAALLLAAGCCVS